MQWNGAWPHYLMIYLAGLILPHDHFGSHLNASGKTNVSELAAISFYFSGL